MAIPDELLPGSQASQLPARAARSSTTLPRRRTADGGSPIARFSPRVSSPRAAALLTTAQPGSPASPAPRSSQCPQSRLSFSLDMEASAQPAAVAASALALAMLARCAVLPPTALAAHVSAATAHFSKAEPGGGVAFQRLLFAFSSLLASAPLRSADWLPAARAWRLALLQEEDGGWAAGAGLALCCLAPASRDSADPSAASPLAMLAEMPAALRDAMGAPSRRLSTRRISLLRLAGVSTSGAAEPVSAASPRAPPPTDGAAVERVWATALAEALAQRLPATGLDCAPPGEGAASSWLASRAASDPGWPTSCRKSSSSQK
jgi:hypothetical protein